MRRLRLLALALLAATACHAAAGNQSSPGIPPIVIGGSPAEFLCPGDHAFAAYGRLVYPPNHPTKPDVKVRPVRCFASVGEVEAAGFRIAPPPPGGIFIEGVYLVPPSTAVSNVCRRAARQLHFGVPCPALIPTTWEPEPYVGASGGGFFLTETFPQIGAQYAGLGAGIGHLNIWALPIHRFDAADFCPGGQKDGAVHVPSAAGEWIVCPEASVIDGDHIELRWILHGIIYTVSLHGHTAANRALALAIADHLQMVK